MLCSTCFSNLQTIFNHSRPRRTILVSMMQLSVFLMLFTSSLAAPTADHKRSTTNSRNLCHYYSVKEELSCDYHDSCIEDIFQCNADGFHIGYSKPRCNAVKQLRTSTDTCDSCLVHQELVNWGIATEECIQPRLQQLAIQWAAKVSPLTTPDSQHCIQYEKEALEELKSCYKESMSPVCDLLTDELNEEFVTDLGKLASSFAIGDYYRPIIHDHLREVLKECSASIAVKTVTKAIPHPQEKILFCAVVAAPIDGSVLSEVISLLNDSVAVDASDFAYADLSGNSVERNLICQKRAPIGSSGAQLEGYRLIQWSPSEIPTLKTSFYKKQLSDVSKLLFFQYPQSVASCGNGVREAGELCDTFVDIGNRDYGCNSVCQPFSNFECSSDQLVISNCINSYCGDGMRSSLEECDDSNVIDNDGCSSVCTIEPMSECTELSYNETSQCKIVLQPEEETSSISPSIITPSSVSSSMTTTSSIAMTTAITRPTVEPSVITEPPQVSLHSSAHRLSSVSWWLTVLLILSLILIR